jgi:hypothetical protein
VADFVTDEGIDSPGMGNASLGSASALAERTARRSNYGDTVTALTKSLVKGVGQITKGVPLSEAADNQQIMSKSHQAIVDVRAATHEGAWETDSVMGRISPDFWANRATGGIRSMASRDAMMRKTMGEFAGKSFTAGNLGTAGVPYGLVPFDLLAPSRLIYPVYTLFRNKFPRPAGQGSSRQVYGLLGISGSQTGGQGIIDISIPELVTSGGSLTTNATWPLNIPKTGTQTEYKLNVPYRFFGLSESLSWLAQFESQGFEDISALANLVLLQEMMLGEEYQMIAGSSQNLAAPGAPTVTMRTAGSNESALTGVTTNVSVKVTALNYFGESIASASSGNVAWSAGQVADVVIAPVAGAQQYNIYATTSSGATWYLMAGTSVQSGTGTAGSTTYQGTQTANSVGGYRFTLQGPISTATNASGPGSATANCTATSVDTGTGSSNRMEGLIPTLTGLSATGNGPYSNVGFQGSNVWKGGYVNQSVGTHLSTNAIFTALDAMWENNGMNNVSPGVYKADPSEIVADGGDLMRLANDMLLQGNSLNYLLNISQDQISGIRAGAAVAEFVNPVTRSTVKLTVHPWMSQGTALLMSYQLPQTWSHVDNAWEMTVVQDYVSVAWPVIDATFRYSIFLLGAMVAHAPFYSGILQGLQVNDVTPFS